MKAILRLLAVGFTILSMGLVLLGTAATMTISEPLPADDSLRLESDCLSFGHASARSSFDLRLPLINPTDRPRRLVGATVFCTSAGCVWVLPEDLPLEIPQGGRRDAQVHVKTREPGDFEHTITLYTDSASRFEIPLTIRGRVVDPAGDVLTSFDSSGW